MKSAAVAATPDDLQELVRLIVGYRISQAIYVAAELGLADQLKNGSKTLDHLAAATHSDANCLYRVLRLLAGAGLLVESPSHQFALTPIGAGLANDVPGSPAALARMALRKFKWEPWGCLLKNVQTGKTAFSQVHGMGLFEYLPTHPTEGSLFDEAMTASTARDGADIAKCYDFSGFGTLVDVGGGQGLLMASILQANPNLRGILFDLPGVAARGAQVLAKSGVSDRCAIAQGSFFEGLPPGADAYLLRHIIHDWDDDHACRILQNCRMAAGVTGKVLIVERLVGPDHRAGLALLGSDLEMMVNVGGKERTEEEFRALFTEAGLQMRSIIGPIGAAGHVVIEGVPAAV